MTYEEAMRLHKEIKRKYPTLILSGSLVLIHKKLLPFRDIKDLDYCIRENAMSVGDLPEGCVELVSEESEDYDYVPGVDGHVFHYLFEGKKIPINIFRNHYIKHSDKKVSSVLGSYLRAETIMEYKISHGRDKDYKDLQQIKENEL
tara:strand:- start:892 stop:1329 length:438 start_codon:yes stop_codon:yes gene_type:complete